MTTVRSNPENKLLSQFAAILQADSGVSEKETKEKNKERKKQIQDLLTPAILDAADEENGNIVFIAARFADDEIFRIICRYVIKNQKGHLLRQPCINGNTPLHAAARFNKFSVVKRLLKKLGSHANDAAKAMNNRKFFPVQFAEKNPHGKKNKEKIIKALEKRMKINDLIPLSEPVKLGKVLAEHRKEIKNHPELAVRFAYVVRLINMIRSVFIYSETHPNAKRDPSSNPISVKVMQDFQAPIISDIAEKTTCALNELEDEKPTDEIIQKVISILKKHSIDIAESNYARFYPHKKINCGHLAEFVMRAAQRHPPAWAKDKLYLIEEYALINGDHAFNIFGRDPASHPSKPTTGIVGDAWAGSVFLVKNLPEKAKNYVEYKKHQSDKTKPEKLLKVITRYNRHVHALKCLSSNYPDIEILHLLPSEKRKKSLLYLDENEKNELQQTMGDPLILLKIYFRYIDEFKDEDYARNFLASRDVDGDTALHQLAGEKNPKTIQFVFKEYKKYFGDGLAALLFGQDGTDLRFLQGVLIEKNFAVIKELCVHVDLEIIQKQVAGVLKVAEENPGICCNGVTFVQLKEFILEHYSHLLPRECLQSVPANNAHQNAGLFKLPPLNPSRASASPPVPTVRGAVA